jgi:DNA-directed RNA polymerase specialized sigma24 family protein
MALVLRTAHGMSYAEIAESLGVSINAAMLLVTRAREALIPLLADFVENFSED